MEELTYSVLVDGICKKIGLNDSMRNLKLSYIPLVAKPFRESCIVDDGDVYVYLTTVDKEGLRAILNVELMEDIESEELPRTEDAPDIEGQQGQQRDQLIVYNPEEAEEQQGQPKRMENVDLRVSCEIEGQQGQTERMENVDLRVSCEIALPEENAECGMHEDVDEHDHVEPLRPVEQTRFVLEWEDGAGFEKGQEFRSKEALRVLVDRASHKGCFEVKTVKSDTGRLILRCRQAELGCTWYLHAVRIVDSTYFSIRVYRNIHTCSRVVSSTIRNKRKGTPQVVAEVLRGCYPGEVDTPAPKALIKVVQNEAHVNVSYSTALRGKKLAISEVRGSPEESYQKLYCYLYMLQLVNPGTITSVKLDAKNKFKYLFVALGASIEGFRAMRKVIVVDATFLKSVYGGMLVFATAQDPNHHYPIAMGVIDSEKDASWKWFFETLKTVIPDDKELVFMSDRHKSIIGAVKEVYPQSQHGYCIWHLSQNVRGKAGIGCKDLCAVKFRECAHKYTERDKYNLDTNNVCESMNSVFKKARKYALLLLIDAYVEKISEWFNKHRKDTAYASDSKTLVPYVENQLHSLCAIGTRLFVTELNATHLEYSVIGDDGKSYLVDLLSKCCSCRRFDIDKIPCVHAIAADIAMMRSAERRREIHLHELCSKYYHIDTWPLAYYRTIYMVPHQSTWIIPDEIQKLVVLPPDYTKKHGRKQDKRYPSTGEARRKGCNKSKPGIHLGRWFEPLNPRENQSGNQSGNESGNPI
ncbi:uncharacterized protein LOC112086527 [Eutrema salsugineum]|uniref:uncharacterized protein LOC112086527 n=1 Tax=Eutrema salsugineum TaxID=72664 RepID=UPI000CED21E6|nr:uncharacterized protein LOC112086527 [Eutrema salsugineum]